MRKIISSVLLAAFSFSAANAAKADDQVTSLPECGPLPSKWYSGYLNATATKALQYVFIESLDQPATDPVVVWFGGGPGCSSYLGLFQEIGPYIIDDGETVIKPNPEPWNKRANMLYIETPAGVGFSIANGTNDTNHTDMSQSIDTLNAVKHFFNMFPEYLVNDLFISGESYAGIYVPYLTWQLHQWNLQAKLDRSNKTTIYNLKGFMVGNGATNWNYDADASYAEIFANFNLIPQSLLQEYKDNECKFSWRDMIAHNNSATCDDIWGNITEGIKPDSAGYLNIYDLFRKIYPDTGLLKSQNRVGSVIINGETKTYKRGYTMADYTPWIKRIFKDNENHPILGDYTTDYVNRADVRAALHIPDYVQAWQACNGDGIKYHTFVEGSQWIYPILKGYGYKLLHYSGDSDGAVGTQGTKQWIQELNFPITNSWRQWKTDGKVSGFQIDYDNFKFATVHGVGHMAPQWARKDVTSLISKFIHNEPIN